MPDTPSNEYFRSRGILPFLSDFACEFLEHEVPAYFEFVSPAGTGKTVAGAAIITRFLEIKGPRRILILTPASLTGLWLAQLERSAFKPSPLLIERRMYMELESNVPVGKTIWPLQIVAVMSLDLARRNEIAESIAGVYWDLVVVDESHQLKGKRRVLVENLIVSGQTRRALLFTATPGMLIRDVKRVVVQRKEMTNWDGKPVFEKAPRKLLYIPYQRSGEELEFFHALEEFCAEVSLADKRGIENILSSAASSYFAVEAMLHRVLEVWQAMRRTAKASLFLVGIGSLLSGPLLGMTASSLMSHTGTQSTKPSGNTLKELNERFPTWYKMLEALLDLIEEMSDDAKLKALLHYVKQVCDSAVKPYLCVWSSFEQTAQYIAASVEEIGVGVYLLTGTLTNEEQTDRLEAFRDNGGVLVITDSLADVVTLECIEECINYDLPETSALLEQRWDRIDRYGRGSKLKMLALKDESGAFSWEEEIMEELVKELKTRDNPEQLLGAPQRQ